MGDPTHPNFDPIARPYRWLEYLTFGPYLERTRFHFLDHLAEHRRALILGDGDGRFTARLLAANPEITIDAVDSSLAMLDLLTERVRRLGPSARQRLRTVQCDAQALAPAGPYDLVITHFFLDCFANEQLGILFRRITPHLAPGAIWLVSEFAIAERQPISAISRLVVWALYRAFRLVTGLRTTQLPNYAQLLRASGFSLSSHRSHLKGMLVSQLWQLAPSLEEAPGKQPHSG